MQALFVDMNGIYPTLLGAENCWGEARDARTYDGTDPVVAHPPCQLWTAMCNVNYKRYGGEHNRPGNDGGCFSFALRAVFDLGGVLEHPAESKAFAAYGIGKPTRGSWQSPGGGVWITEVSQCAYGHRARKRTWLVYSGRRAPPAVDWSEPAYTHQIGRDSKMKRPRPALGKREACASPVAFAQELIALARWSRG